MNTQSELNLLLTKIQQWAINLGLHKNSTPELQILKLYEEFGEVSRAIQKSDKIELMDGIGDTIVVMTVIYLQSTVSDTRPLRINPYAVSYREKSIEANFIECSQNLTDYTNNAIATRYYQPTCLPYLLHSFEQTLTRMNAICEYYQFTLEECLKMAYTTIHFRSGEIVDGIFVKVDADGVIKLPVSILKEDINSIISVVCDVAAIHNLKFYKIKFDNTIDKITI